MAIRQLECRVVITHRRDHKLELGMYCPATCRYEPLGTHGPGQFAKDAAVRGLVERIQREGHLLTFSEVTEPR